MRTGITILFLWVFTASAQKKTTTVRIGEAETKIEKLEKQHLKDSITIKKLEKEVAGLTTIEFDPPWYLIPLNAEKTKFRVIYSLTKPSPEILSPVFKKK